jgi:hypothetical protein
MISMAPLIIKTSNNSSYRVLKISSKVMGKDRTIDK